jgi:hypothetical protein
LSSDNQTLDQLYLFVVAHTPQLCVAGVNRNIAGPLGLLHNSACMSGVAGAWNRAAFHELDTVATILQAHDIEIRFLMLTNVVVVGYTGCHTAARFLSASASTTADAGHSSKESSAYLHQAPGAVIARVAWGYMRKKVNMKYITDSRMLPSHALSVQRIASHLSRTV